MSMFDNVRCEHALPDGWQPDELQTKDFDCEMTTYTIREDGRLMVERNEWEATPEDELPYPNTPIIGCIRSKRQWHEDTNFHGCVYFYGLEVVGRKEPDERGWSQPIYRSHDYIAKFTDGQLVSLFVTDEDGSQTPPQDASEGGSTSRRTAPESPFKGEV